MTNHRVLMTFLCIASSLINLSCVNDCEPVGKSWCDGDIRKTCVIGNMRVDGPGNIVSNRDCTEHDATCMETVDQDNEKTAVCALSTNPCPAGVGSICVGNAVADCMDTGYPIFRIGLGDCAGRCPHPGVCNQHCVESEIDKKALCAYLKEPCDRAEAKMCATEDKSIKIECSEGFWRVGKKCPYGEECVESADGGVSCNDLAN
ncbi:MAG: hypothetical protein GY847_33560 [Proteobacteria bacterium]|nr:hypothetical protein [Pseudomonadota bacterium]